MTEFIQTVSPYLPAHIFDIIMVPLQIIILLFIAGGISTLIHSALQLHL